ncbi:MAG: hypothetical protein GX552_16275 [Chloroflexi bacterium]|jgi:uroporphyrinogen-III decarboxylase|nr:hypothetical protein [Chloroflexota bacterium]
MGQDGKKLALDALRGIAAERIPVGPLTWGYEYLWKIAGLEPWQLACGGSETWHRAHMAMLERHDVDVLWYEGAGNGPEEPTLLDETSREWVIRDNNTGHTYGLMKDSLALYELEDGPHIHIGTTETSRAISSREEADERIPPFQGWGSIYLDGLRRLIAEVGDRALILPHHSPGYIIGCYEFGFQAAMETMLSDPELFFYVCDRFAEGDQLRMTEWAAAGAEAVYIADSWASCDIISPRMFEQFALPYQRSITEAAHLAGLPIILWNVGDVLPILDLEASLPVDAFAIEQPRKGVDLTIASLRPVFGSNRCLMGNVDSEDLLRRNNPDEIKQAVADQIRQSGQGNPFIVSTGSPLPSNTEPAAVDAMIQAVRTFHF